MTDSVDVLLSTYNGEKFLSAQIDSLLNQTYKNWRLIIRDDLSNDGTMLLVNEYKTKYPDKISILDNQSVKKGIVGSFECLIEGSSAHYVAFCDQDDVWLPNKLQLQMERIIKLEGLYGRSMPILVHTDLIVVNDELDLIGASFWRYQHLAPKKMNNLQRQLVQNCVTGCTVLVNRSLLALALPIPKGVIMHDWWLALIAVSEGKVCEMNITTVKYRQHDNNDTGAKRWGLSFIFKSIRRDRNSQKLSLMKTRIQAEELLKLNSLSDKNRKIVERYILMYNSNWVARRIEMFRMGFFKYGLLRNIAMFLRI